MDTAKKKSKRGNKTSNTVGPGKDRVKAVVRRLPANLPEDIFWQSVQAWVTSDAVSWKVFYPGKVRKAYNKLSTPSRAYIAFKTGEQLLAFSQGYDGHTFRDKQGQESHAIVEFAPCQKVPNEKKKVDSRIGTVEQDEDYISFVASLKAPVPKPGDSDNLEFLVASTRPPPSPKTTPLLEALQAERSAARDKEAILKAHAHYRDGRARDGPGKGSAVAPKKEEKRKTISMKEKADEQRSHGPTVSPGKKGRRSRKADPATLSSSAPSLPLPSKPNSGPASSKAPTKATVTKPARSQSNAITVGETSKSPATKNIEKPPDQPQRSRPTITLQSRQFEAALSGAVPRARREREINTADKEPSTPLTTHAPEVVVARPKRGVSDRGARRGGARSPTGQFRHIDDGFGRIDDSPPPSAVPKVLLRPPASGQPSGPSEAVGPSLRGRGRGRGGAARGARAALPSRGGGPSGSIISGDG